MPYQVDFMMFSLRSLARLILVAFSVGFILFSIGLYHLTQHNVEVETSAAMGLVQRLIAANSTNTNIIKALENNPHIKIERVSGRLNQGVSPQNQHDILFIPAGENQFITVSADSSAVLQHQLRVFWLVAVLFLFTLCVILIFMYFAKKEHAAKNARLHSLNHKLALAEETERRYLASELHDNLGQILTSMKAFIYLLEQVPEPQEHMRICEKLSQYCHTMSDDIRRITHHLHPLMFDQLGLQDSLQRLFADTQTAHSDVEMQFDIQLHDHHSQTDRDIHIYRIIQESLNNALKHAQADLIQCHVQISEGHLIVEIRDNGIGFELSKLSNGIGLYSIYNRADCLGAKVKINSAPNKGTSLLLHVPEARDENFNC